MINIAHPWFYFCCALAVMLFSTLLMGAASKWFFSKDPLRRSFSILELEFPSNEHDLKSLLDGIFTLPEDAGKTVNALRKHTFLDSLLFIPATYGGIFILCMQVAGRLTDSWLANLFIFFAWAQVASALLDYIENAHILLLLKRAKERAAHPQPRQHQDDFQALKIEKPSATFIFMQWLELFKWGFALIGATIGFSALAFFWINGTYTPESLQYVFYFLGEVGLFIVIALL